MTKHVVLDSKTILAHSLSSDQANRLVQYIRSRAELKPLFDNRTIWTSSGKPKTEGDDNTWYVYVVDESLRDAFLACPEDFIFEI